MRLLCRRAQTISGKLKLNVSEQQVNSSVFRNEPDWMFEVLASVPHVLHGIFCKSAWICTVDVVHVADAPKENANNTGKKEAVRVSLYYLYWSLRDKRLQF